MTEKLVEVDVQLALADDSEEPPSALLISEWANRAYKKVAASPTEVTIRLVDELEMVKLNESYRGKHGATNVLSFPFENEFDFADMPNADSNDESDSVADFLGDIVICHAVIQREAKEQNKSELNHYAHMVTHGLLHLCGYDHIDNDEAEEMEALEVIILALSDIENPYT